MEKHKAAKMSEALLEALLAFHYRNVVGEEITLDKP